MSDNTADISGAIAALTSTLESMENRQREISSQISAAKLARRERLDQEVIVLLPEISSSTMSWLRLKYPGFAADRKIEAAFEQNKKVFWFFKPSGYDEALALLQAQLKLYLERQGFVREDDQTIQQLVSEKTTLAYQQAEALEMLRMMEHARRSAVPLPAEAVSSINILARRGRNLGGQRFYRAPAGVSRFAGSQSSATTQASSESDMDLWLWMMTDIPTSFRTLMLGSFSHHHSNSSHPAKEAGAPENDSASADSVLASPPGHENEPFEPIATDDRLGVFS